MVGKLTVEIIKLLAPIMKKKGKCVSNKNK